MVVVPVNFEHLENVGQLVIADSLPMIAPVAAAIQTAFGIKKYGVPDRPQPEVNGRIGRRLVGRPLLGGEGLNQQTQQEDQIKYSSVWFMQATGKRNSHQDWILIFEQLAQGARAGARSNGDYRRIFFSPLPGDQGL